MPSLFGVLSIATGSLMAEQGALNTTSNNIANANTPGYSRQKAVLVEGEPVTLGSLTMGSGVVMQKIEAVRDPILELSIDQETQQQSQLDTLVSAMSQVQTMFSGSDSDIGNQISAFFTSVNRLSTDPSNMALRQGVLTAAGNMTAAFRNTVAQLAAQQSNIDQNVTQSVQEVNTLTDQIAALNGRITGMQNLGEDASALVDQRDVFIGKLAGLVDVSSIRSDGGLTLTTKSGATLVAGDTSFALSTQTDSSGLQHIFSQGSDITGQITLGEVGGLLKVRDEEIPAVLAQLDTLAAGLGAALNAANRGGYDLSGNAGGDIFTPAPASGKGAAASFALMIKDPSLIASSSDGSAGSNGNLAAIEQVHDQAVAGGNTPTDYYANIVFGVGSAVSNASAELNASQLVLQQLRDQRNSVSGVSLDEEATNLIQYQRAYEASARVVSTINSMLDVTINLGRY
jgi:flagellar hook-associated protein 1 FlgK